MDASPSEAPSPACAAQGRQERQLQATRSSQRAQGVMTHVVSHQFSKHGAAEAGALINTRQAPAQAVRTNPHHTE